ncbi:M6 family metalloprotease domain-containing protein [Streptomyces sp. NPDC003077]|uniref:M6 family metalloprotease domain-containing protein n=1 Tax=Streptomyces sp. NPDC003077 TaxID=3154443 RepID=UPI0033A9126F
MKVTPAALAATAAATAALAVTLVLDPAPTRASAAVPSPSAAPPAAAIPLGAAPVAQVGKGGVPAAPTPSAASPSSATPASSASPASAARPSGPCALSGLRAGASEAAATPKGYARSSGTVRALTLLIDFPDVRAPLTPEARYGEFFPATAEFFRASSYGRLDYRSTPRLKWIRMPRSFASYGIKRGASFVPGTDTGYYALSRDLVSAVDDEVDFRDYDVVNVLATPNAGPPATRTVLSGSFSGGNLGLRTKDGVPLSNVSFMWSRQTGESAFRALNHENAHTFGLPDLYFTDGRKAPPPVGHWDPMDEDWGPDNDFLGWHKWKLGWLRPGQVECAARPGAVTEHTLTPTRSADGTKIVVIPVSARAAFVLEARERGRLDPSVCRAGVLITWVRTDVPSGRGPIRTVDATPRSRGCYASDENVDTELSDAQFLPGQRFTDRESGAAVTVLGRDAHDNYRVRVRAARVPGKPKD